MDPSPSRRGLNARLPLSLAAAALLAVLPPIAIAQSRLARAVDQLEVRMTAAEHRYREALVLIGNNDPTGVAEADAALEDMEDAVMACAAQRGCETTTLLATYKRLLKSGADEVFPGDDAAAIAKPDHARFAQGLSAEGRSAALRDGSLLAEARIRVGFIDAAGRPRRQPAAWRRAFASIAPDPEG